MTKVITASQARSDIYYLIDEMAQSYEPIFIQGNNDNTAVLISETLWEEIQDRFDAMIADQRIDDIKNGKSEVYTLEEVMKKIKSNDNLEILD